jgi:aspartate 1-decarboxylase
VQPGDAVIIFSYASYDEAELESFAPTFIFVDAENRIASRAARRTA